MPEAFRFRYLWQKVAHRYFMSTKVSGKKRKSLPHGKLRKRSGLWNVWKSIWKRSVIDFDTVLQ